MAVSGELAAALRNVFGSDVTVWRRATKLIRDHGPMTADEARWVLAHQANIDLRRYGLTHEQLDRVRQLRKDMGQQQVAVTAKPPKGLAGTESADAGDYRPQPITPASLFNSRQLHAEVVASSRRLFVSSHYTEAIRKAFQRLNNRVRQASQLPGRDGEALMSEAFKDVNPALQMSPLRTDSEKNEHAGVRSLLMGGMRAMRNPRSHEDSWAPDQDPVAVLEALALASMLHRFLDRCDAYSKALPSVP